MLKHHGLFLKDTHGKKHSQVHFEIRALFQAICGTENFQPDLTPDDLQKYRESVTRLDYHFGTVLNEFIFLLDLFQYNLTLFEIELNKESYSFHTVDLSNKTASVAAKSILVTLGVLLDDIAKLVHIVYKSKILDNNSPFRDVKKSVTNRDKAYGVDLGILLKDLEKESSWYHINFEYGLGLRQRFVHYEDTLTFRGSKINGIWKARCSVTSLYPEEGLVNHIDYVEHLRKTMYGLCDFLDKLYEILYKKLQSRCDNWPAVDLQYKYGRYVNLPTFMTEFSEDGREGSRKYLDEDYCYLPLSESI